MMKSENPFSEEYRTLDEMQAVDLLCDIMTAEEQLRNGQFISNTEASKRLLGFAQRAGQKKRTL